jgi:hypothetical protein
LIPNRKGILRGRPNVNRALAKAKHDDDDDDAMDSFYDRTGDVEKKKHVSTDVLL